MAFFRSKFVYNNSPTIRLTAINYRSYSSKIKTNIEIYIRILYMENGSCMLLNNNNDNTKA